MLDKVHNIHLPALENLEEKAKKELFKNDGIHLTKAGLGALEDNLIQGIKNVYTDIKGTDYHDDSRIQQEHGGGRDDHDRHGPGRHGAGWRDSGRHGAGAGGGGGYRL